MEALQSPIVEPYGSSLQIPYMEPSQTAFIDSYTNFIDPLYRDLQKPLINPQMEFFIEKLERSLTRSLHRQLLYIPYENLYIPPSRNHIEAPYRSLIWSPCRNPYRFLIEILQILYVETLQKPIIQKNYRSPAERLSRNPLWIPHMEPLQQNRLYSLQKPYTSIASCMIETTLLPCDMLGSDGMDVG